MVLTKHMTFHLVISKLVSSHANDRVWVDIVLCVQGHVHTQCYMKITHYWAYRIKNSLAGKLQNYGFKATLFNVHIEKGGELQFYYYINSPFFSCGNQGIYS